MKSKVFVEFKPKEIINIQFSAKNINRSKTMKDMNIIFI